MDVFFQVLPAPAQLLSRLSQGAKTPTGSCCLQSPALSVVLPVTKASRSQTDLSRRRRSSSGLEEGCRQHFRSARDPPLSLATQRGPGGGRGEVEDSKSSVLLPLPRVGPTGCSPSQVVLLPPSTFGAYKDPGAGISPVGVFGAHDQGSQSHMMGGRLGVGSVMCHPDPRLVLIKAPQPNTPALLVRCK